jgi:hypothetical protein
LPAEQLGPIAFLQVAAQHIERLGLTARGFDDQILGVQRRLAVDRVEPPVEPIGGAGRDRDRQVAPAVAAGPRTEIQRPVERQRERFLAAQAHQVRAARPQMRAEVAVPLVVRGFPAPRLTRHRVRPKQLALRIARRRAEPRRAAGLGLAPGTGFHVKQGTALAG